ncbi:MAG: DUF3990 domain-containing protein [Oscillospiraceae bacterium]|nr:DUF3990 domain-containing protein [Clostridia bacterium]MBQ8617829.1 DUF3990 domain-containing protein [Clostridia bacterium]MBQ9166908.1 DUF3990 domain-containing protein [Oscillospiraceae bacterium]
MRKLYHGSKDIIQKPIYGYGKSYNDYGLGFYCTDSSEMAMEWAVAKDRDGYANAYELDCDGLSILDLNAPQYSILTWLAILLENREFDATSPLAQEAKEYLLQHFMIDYRSYDAIIGYRADDSYFSFAEDFISGAISYRQLSNAMHLGKLGQQFVLISPKAFERIRFTGYEVALNSEWYARKMLRDKAARREYFNVERNRRQRGDLYITTIMDEEMKLYDPRL